MLLTLNDKDYLIPQKWTEVSLGSYQKFTEATTDETDEHTANLNALCALIGVPMEVLEKCKKNDIDQVIEVLGKLTEVVPNTTLNLIVEIDGKRYGFHPNLKDITFGEFVDLDNYLENPLKNLHKVMGVLYREITFEKKGKYTIEEYDSLKALKNAELFKDKLSIGTVNGAAAFFLNIGKEYQAIMLSSFKANSKKMKSKLQNKRSVESGDGMELSTV